MNVVFLFGILMIVFGAYSIYIYLRNLRKPYTIVSGKIIDFKEHTSHKGYKGFTTIFEYYYQGTVYNAAHNINCAKYCKNSKIKEGLPRIYYTKNISIVPSTKYNIGDSIDVRVYENDPENAVINTKASAILSLLIGITCVIIGAVVLVIYFY